MLTPKRRQLLLLALCAAFLALCWWRAPQLVGLLIFDRPTETAPTLEQVGDVESLQELIATSLPSVGIREDQRLEQSPRPREDQGGSWNALHERWQLSSEADPMALAKRLESLVGAQDPSAEIYVVELDGHQAQLRFYAGSRLAAVLLFETSLSSWPTLARGEQPWLALVIHGVDQDPHGVRRLMASDFPLAVALSPHSPFTLRLSRDALLEQTEVLAKSEPGVSLTETLEAVPHASGLLLTCPPSGEPSRQARALRDADVYVLDAADGGLGGRWLRAFQDAGVPHVRAMMLEPDDIDTGRRRFLHSAAREGAAAMVVHAADGAAMAEVQQLLTAMERGYRATFPAEVVERLR